MGGHSRRPVVSLALGSFRLQRGCLGCIEPFFCGLDAVLGRVPPVCLLYTEWSARVSEKGCRDAQSQLAGICNGIERAGQIDAVALDIGSDVGCVPTRPLRGVPGGSLDRRFFRPH